ncbi:MAG TPA: DEAD/DEAH box helicase [Acidimicrobiales bacterium]|jgi:superfamily II DNA/RNA helicase
MSTTFHALGAPQAVADRLAARGITEPFPIQALTLPDALAGRDVCGKAPTGSGKTIAFGIPMVTRLTGKSKPRHPRGLVLVPTRELAAQVAEELQLLAGPKGLHVATFYGGVGFGTQMAAVRRGVDIAVACPGRLADLVQRDVIRLSEVELVVIDEADRMADMGFLPEVKRLLDRVRSDRQTLLFSATLDGDVDVLVQRYQRDPARHELAEDENAPQNRHIFWKVDRTERVGVAAEVVNREWPAIVFTRTKHGADRLTKQLTKLGVSAAAIHGDRSQAQRDRALAAFAGGKVQALVATDVAARGIHVDAVAAVVHFDLPASEKDYVHRAGRTGRAGATGIVVSLVDKEMTRAAEDLQRRLGYNPGLDWADLDALTSGRQDAVAAEPGAIRPSGQMTDPRRGTTGNGNGRGRSAGKGAGRGSAGRTNRDPQNWQPAQPQQQQRRRRPARTA